jgi:hypothetical protein
MTTEREKEASNQRSSGMKIAIPITGGKLSAHFGHCEGFALVDADAESRTITSTQIVAAPPHEPGLLPRWLAEKGAQMRAANAIRAIDPTVPIFIEAAEWDCAAGYLRDCIDLFEEYGWDWTYHAYRE